MKKSSIFIPIITSVTIFTLDELLSLQLFHPKKWWLLLFFSLLFGVTFVVSHYYLEKSPKSFHNFFFGAMFFRLLTSICILSYAVYQKVTLLPNFLITFFVLYIGFVSIETYYMYNTLSQK